MAEKSQSCKVSTRMWKDKKFLALSPMPPSGQALWIYLQIGPYTVGRKAMADDLGWPPEAFDAAFQECLDHGLIEVAVKARVLSDANSRSPKP